MTAVSRLNNTAKDDTAVPPSLEATGERVSGGETVARLQRGILRLALGYHGHNNALDGKLKQLGKLLRGGHRDARLQNLIDEIVETIVSLGPDLDNGSTRKRPPEADRPELLRHFLEHVDARGTLAREIDALSQLLGGKRENAAILAQVEHTARALSSELNAATSDAGRLEAAREALVELIERIPVPSGLTADASSLKRTILSAKASQELKSCIAGLADLVGRIRQELQSELDNLSRFLVSTAQRLQEFERHITRTRKLHSDASSDAMQLSETMSSNFTELRDDVGEAGDLESVKHLIEEKLDSINEDLDRYVLTQTRRAHEASDTIDKMLHKLQDLEAEAEHLREDLEEQHARVLIDPLTGILNRSGYVEMANKQFARWKRYGGALSLAVIDLDLFKQINDRYGHAAGDKVLSTVSAKLNERIRDSDILCRYGGEEFVLLLPETSASDAVMLLDKLRCEIEHCPFRYKETPVSVTLSCGIAQFEKGETLEEVFERADQAMYQAKANGRNQVYSDVAVADA